MNLYLLVEGRRTEAKVYPAWIKHLIPRMRQAKTPRDLNSKRGSFYLFSGNGYPRLLGDPLRRSIEDVNMAGRYDHLVVCLDADERTVSECEK